MYKTYLIPILKIAVMGAVIATPILGGCYTALAQNDGETGIHFKKHLDIEITNPTNMARANEPVKISLDDILGKASDFNKRFFRVKHSANMFEPLDIPSQIVRLPWNKKETLVFLLDIGPKEIETVEIWYNPEGEGIPDYPVQAKVYEKWYHIGSNIAWENEQIAYRSYSGIVDYFAKTYPHMRLHDLPPDSYHHEGLWGLDPYLVGAKPGIGGVMLFAGSRSEQCYSVEENSPLRFDHKGFADGPVCAGASVQVKQTDELKVTSHFMLFAGRFDNDVTIEIPVSKLTGDLAIAPGMQKFDGERFLYDEHAGYFLAYGSPVAEYGTIATAFVWNPSDSEGEVDRDDGHFIKLKPDKNGKAHYRSVAVWYRASALQPESSQKFEQYVQGLALSFNNPLKVTIK
ncbi:MAG: DUF4861 family protein [Candidatus Latescibacteria bacterium]|nr:DUF4861 family protein [Candidatus Latescibacterota bacterium]